MKITRNQYTVKMWQLFIVTSVLCIFACTNRNPIQQMAYPSSVPKENENLKVLVSTDGNLQIYAWNDGTGNYNGGNHNVVQYRHNGKTRQTSFDLLKYPELQEEDDPDLDCRGFELYTMHLDDKTFYLIECSYMKATGRLGNRDISIYAFEGDKLVKQTLFRTSKELLSEIGIEYDAANYWDEIAKESEEKGAFDWLFRYDDEQKMIYVPLVNDDISYGRVTDNFLLYKWDGNYFTYIGKQKLF